MADEKFSVSRLRELMAADQNGTVLQHVDLVGYMLAHAETLADYIEASEAWHDGEGTAHRINAARARVQP